MSEYFWLDKKENGVKNPRARKIRKITDEEYLERISKRDNYRYLYAQKEDNGTDRDS